MIAWLPYSAMMSLPARRDLGDRLVPGDARELAASPLRPRRGAADKARGRDCSGGRGSPSASRKGVPRVIGWSLLPAHLDELAVLHLVDHGAGVGAVMRDTRRRRFCVPADRSCLEPSLRDLLRRLLAAGNRIEPTDAPRTCRSARREKIHDFGELRASLSDAGKGDWTKALPPFIFSVLRAAASALKWPKSALFVTIKAARHCLGTMHIEPIVPLPSEAPLNQAKSIDQALVAEAFLTADHLEAPLAPAASALSRAVARAASQLEATYDRLSCPHRRQCPAPATRCQRSARSCPRSA